MAHPITTKKELYGSLPQSLSDASSLKSLTVYGNSLTGTLDSVGTAFGLELFDGHYNQFSGTLPASIGKQSNLSYFSVANNNLHGHIPSSWAKLGS